VARRPAGIVTPQDNENAPAVIDIDDTFARISARRSNGGTAM
jgi:hypothetical protein